jgi:oxysterol-binding protein 1
VAWIEALVSARGLGEEIIKDREQSVHSEFSQYHSRTKQLSEEYLSFPGSLPRQREVRFLQELPSIDKKAACVRFGSY